MTNFDTPTIDTILSQFPFVAGDIFNQLDNISLIKCRKVSVPWQNFIDNEKFSWIRRMQKYSDSMKEFLEQWKQVIRNTPVDPVKELSLAVLQFFDDDVSRSKKQYSPLHVTADRGLLELSKSIILKTGDKNPAGCDEYTALHMAALKGRTEVCRHIIEIVDDKNPVCISGIYVGLTPYHIAALFGHLEICELYVETLDDKNPETLLRITPLHYAAENGHLEVCKVIVDSVEDKNLVAYDGDTPLHRAAKGGHLEIIRLLIDNGVERRQTYNGWTPIQTAASYGHFRSCLYLMSSFQDIVSFFKGIWNSHSKKSEALLLVMALLFWGTVITIILSMIFKYGIGIEKNDNVIDYIKDKIYNLKGIGLVRCKSVPHSAVAKCMRVT